MNGGLMTLPDLEPRLPHKHKGMKINWLQADTWSRFREQSDSTHQIASSAPIWSVQQRDHSFALAQPLMVRFRQDGEYFFAENDTLQLVGTGTSAVEALADFFEHYMYFHRYYANIPFDRLTGEAVRLKRAFQELSAHE